MNIVIFSSILLVYVTIARQQVSGCSENEIQCNITKQCIPKDFVCDDYLDCGEDDVTDEIDCGVKGCRTDQFFCRENRRCIPTKWTCNNKLDCGGLDFTDEQNCTQKPPCDGKRQFLCNSGKCMSSYKLCDGVNDCKDNSDEESYDCVSRSCYNNDFSCGKGQCISPYNVCDGEKQCVDGSDEDPYMCENIHCTFEYWESAAFRCGDGRCIGLDVVCDSYYQCDDNSDEKNAFCDAWRGTFGNVSKWLKLTSNRTNMAEY